MVEGATLGLRLSNSQAIADAKASGAAFEDMGNKGETAARKIAGSSTPVTDAIRKQAAEMDRAARAANFVRGGLFGITYESGKSEASLRKMTLTQLEAIRINEAMGQSANTNRLSLGRLGNQFTSLAGQIAGVPPVAGNLLSVLGNFAVGSMLMTGVLGALALLAVAWDKLTGESRKAMEAGDKLAESYNRLARIRLFGSQQAADIADINKGLEQHNKWLGLIIAARALLGPVGGWLSGVQKGQSDAITAGVTARTEAEQQRVNELGLREARNNEAWAARIKDEADKAKAIADKVRAQRDKERAEQFVTNSEAAKHRREDFTSARQMSLVPDKAVKSLDSLLTPALIKAAEAAKQLAASFESAKDRLAFGREGWKPGNIGQGIVAGVQGSIGDALTRFSPANLAGGAVTSLLNTAVSGVIGTLGDLFSSGKKAAEEARKMAIDFRLAADSFHAAATGDTLLAALTSQQRAYQAQLAAIDLQYPEDPFHKGGRKNEARARELAQAAADQAQAEERIRQQHRFDAQYATEDLAVRNLRAMGRGDEAGLLAFQNQQAREMQKAIDENRDAVYRNNLATTLNNELLAFQNGLLSTAIRNQPTGFYGIEAYLGEFASRRGALGGSSGGGADPLSPVNPTGGLTPPGGRNPIYVTFQPGSINVDGQGVVTAVVAKIDQKAASTGGAGSSRAAALELL